jgi:RecB family exonuclease
VRKLIGCPRDYLLGRELRLESDDEPEGLKRLSDARWRGTQLHAIAAKACSRIVQGHADLEDLPEELAEACSTILNDMDPPFPTAILPAVRSDFLARLAVITAQFREGAFTALLGVEQTIHTTLDDGIELSAKYDLLVEGRDGELMVIDLKSGATRDNQYLTRSEEREGEIQRGAYLLCEPKAEAACLLYLNPGPNMLVPTSRDSGRAGWASLTTQTADQLRRDGVFAPTGEVDRRCTTCAMRFACRPWDAVWRGSIGGRAAVLDQQRAEAVEDTR